MRAAFCHVSLLIDLPHEPWLARPQAFLATAKPFPKRSRVLVHESMHYWQQICHGYLLSLAEEDWVRMLAWEQRAIVTPSPVRDAYHTRQGKYRISPEDLCECLARFWEVLFVGADVVLRDAVAQVNEQDALHGPSEELKDIAARETSDVNALDMAMDLSGDYARPYLIVRRAFDRSIGPVIFPLLAHFALKTPRPVEYFDRFVDEAGTKIAAAIAAQVPRVVEFGALAAALYPFARQQCEALVRQTGDTGLLDAPVLFADSGLRENAAYAWSFQRRDALAQKLGRVDGLVDMAVCVPVIDTFRLFLSEAVTPPCIRFYDGTVVGLSDRFTVARSDVARDATEFGVANECRSLQERWESFAASRISWPS